MPGVTSGPALPFPYPAANRVRSRRPAGGSVIIAETVFPLPLSMALISGFVRNVPYSPPVASTTEVGLTGYAASTRSYSSRVTGMTVPCRGLAGSW